MTTPSLLPRTKHQLKARQLHDAFVVHLLSS